MASLCDLPNKIYCQPYSLSLLKRNVEEKTHQKGILILCKDVVEFDKLWVELPGKITPYPSPEDNSGDVLG